jgi:hypothetical protein
LDRLDRRTNWTDVPVVNTRPVQITNSRRDLGDLNQFIGVEAAPIIVKNVSLFVVRDLEFRQ